MRVLIIEDETKVAQFLKKGLQAEAISADIAEDGARGSHLARSETYDAIILDMMLPKKSGLEVLREIRDSKVDAPVLILTAKGDLDDRVEGLNRGADDYLAKPFAFSEVLARLRAIVRRKSSDVQTSVLTIADLRMNLVSREVERSGDPIVLTNKEFEVLEYLLRNKGRVLSRVVLMEHIWDMNFDSDTNIVDVVINRLRRKIDDEHAMKLLHTVRGVGYVLKADADENPAAR